MNVSYIFSYTFFLMFLCDSVSHFFLIIFSSNLKDGDEKFKIIKYFDVLDI